MAVKVSPFGPKPQFFDENGDPLNGGKLYFYAAGSSTPQDSYTSSTGLTANANPVELDADGYPPNELWWTAGLTYKAVLKTAADATIWSIDNLSGINDTTSVVDQWIASGLTPTYVGATSFTLSGDQTSTFHVGRRLKSTISAGTGYHTITASAFSVNTTTVTVNGTSLDVGLSAIAYGILTTDNTSFPVLKDSDFVISGSADQTKKAVFEADSITTATTRVFTLPDRTSTLVTLAGDQTFTGTILKSAQPSFLGVLSSNTDVTGDGTAVTNIVSSEIYDLGTNFNPSTGTFTAPVTGRYDFFITTTLQQVGAGHTGGELSLVTSNRNYPIANLNVGAARNTSNEVVLSGSVIGADLDAADTATVSLTVSGGTKTVDIANNRFSGKLSH